MVMLQLDGWIKKAEMKNYGFLFGKVNSVQNSGNNFTENSFNIQSSIENIQSFYNFWGLISVTPPIYGSSASGMITLPSIC
jgi:hypothetical protein